MDPEDEKQDEIDIEQSTQESKKSAKSFFSKFKKAKFITTVIVPLLPKIIPVLGIAIVVTLVLGSINDAWDWFVNLFGNDNVSAFASAEVIVETNIKKGENGYYFEIDKDLVDKYIKELNEAYKNGNFYLDDEENEEILKEYGLYKNEDGEIVKEESEEGSTENSEEDSEDNSDKKNTKDEFTSEDLQNWFASEEFEDYFVRMLRAEIASSYPKIGTDGSVGKGCVLENDRPNGEIINPKKGENYIAQGIIQIRRQLLMSLTLKNHKYKMREISQM